MAGSGEGILHGPVMWPGHEIEELVPQEWKNRNPISMVSYV